MQGLFYAFLGSWRRSKFAAGKLPLRKGDFSYSKKSGD